MGQPKGAPEPSAPPAAPSLEFPEEGTLSLTNLDVASQEMRALLKKMRVVAIKYHLSDSPRDARDLATEWRKMLAGGHKIHDKLVEGAIEAFREKPNLEGKAGTLLMSVAGRNATMDRFENMLEVVQLLKQHGAASKQFDLYFGLTAAGNNEFALAKPHLESVMVNLENDVKELAKTDKIAEDERKSFAEKMFETYELAKDLAQADVYEPLWQEELKAREADAAGEPLPRVLLETTKGDVVIDCSRITHPIRLPTLSRWSNRAFTMVCPFIGFCHTSWPKAVIRRAMVRVAPDTAFPRNWKAKRIATFSAGQWVWLYRASPIPAALSSLSAICPAHT